MLTSQDESHKINLSLAGRQEDGVLSQSISSRSNVTSRLTRLEGDASKRLHAQLEEKFNQMVERGEM